LEQAVAEQLLRGVAKKLSATALSQQFTTRLNARRESSAREHAVVGATFVGDAAIEMMKPPAAAAVRATRWIGNEQVT
jgi:hypothetical protein